MGRRTLTYRLEFSIDSNGCKTPKKYRLNKDGYFRKRINGNLVMYHRHCYELENGEIPKGMEVDHLCKNRACCNVEHLQLVTSSEHRVKDNTGRHEDKRKVARTVVKQNPEKSMSWVARQVGVSFSATCKWRREGVI